MMTYCSLCNRAAVNEVAVIAPTPGIAINC